MKKRILSIVLIMTLFISLAAPMSFAASGKTKKMKVYSVVKKGDYCYCNPDGGRKIYRTNVKTGKIKKYKIPCWGANNCKIYKGYLYYVGTVDLDDDALYDFPLYRMNLKTGKSKKLFVAKNAHYDENFRYAISKSRLYVYYRPLNEDFDVIRTVKKVMKLNGKAKKNTKFKIKQVFRESNAKGYSLYYDESKLDESGEGWIKVYLKTPGRKIFLKKYYDEI